jgi:sRNA-binding carbon storage regulator CsrA
MLVLRRRLKQSIMLTIGDLRIEVKLLACKGNGNGKITAEACIGIAAPKEVRIEKMDEDCSTQEQNTVS